MSQISIPRKQAILAHVRPTHRRYYFVVERRANEVIRISVRVAIREDAVRFQFVVQRIHHFLGHRRCWIQLITEHVRRIRVVLKSGMKNRGNKVKTRGTLGAYSLSSEEHLLGDFRFRRSHRRRR